MGRRGSWAPLLGEPVLNLAAGEQPAPPRSANRRRADSVSSGPPSHRPSNPCSAAITCSACVGLVYPAYRTLQTVEAHPHSAPAANKWLM